MLNARRLQLNKSAAYPISYNDMTKINLSQWFHDHLRASAEGFVWGVEQIPVERQLNQPPEGLGEWSVARHIFHMAFYEQTYALPGMRQWLGASLPDQKGLDEDVAWDGGRQEIDHLLVAFQKVRDEQIALLEKYDDLAWNTTRETVWGPVTLAWVVSKTYQHTAEHTSDVMRIGLFWDRYAKRR